ncbi:MAG: DUF2059 domain-containing protein [Chryseobacterium sp.]|uniref:DUF2059 domain-containing protein n=1 Tax=Chryseobacterium sp. TaxID=1871047 RepID=UPI0028340F7A|nr:DUF2059 domain-containing protein [Chryseobacterium sp.]MDR2236696.1 DUF2059 domain-containing protein [Chryseobacterium sp.]
MKKLITVVSVFIGTLAFSQASEAKIREFIKVTEADKVAISSMQTYMEQFKKNAPSIPDAFWKEFAAEFTAEKMVELYVPIYAKYYTESDIDELIKFYKSPVGRKTISVMPAILQESMEAGGKLGREVAERVMEKMDKEEGHVSPPPPSSSKKK